MKKEKNIDAASIKGATDRRASNLNLGYVFIIIGLLGLLLFIAMQFSIESDSVEAKHFVELTVCEMDLTSATKLSTASFEFKNTSFSLVGNTCELYVEGGPLVVLESKSRYVQNDPVLYIEGTYNFSPAEIAALYSDEFGSPIPE